MKLDEASNLKAEVVGMDKKEIPHVCYLQKKYFKYKETDNLKIKEQIQIYCANMNYKKSDIAISENVEFKTRNITR